MSALSTRRRLAVFDLETDPFEFGKVPEPFASGFYDGETFITWWGDDCVLKLIAHILTIEEPLIIFAHNGGKFDIFYLLEHLEKSQMRIVNGRIISAHLGNHELRDSFAIMPFPLSAYMKDEIDYNKLHKTRREKHREEIVRYLRGDCLYLHELVTAFFAEFGDKLTVGASAMKQLQTFHTFKRGKQRFDELFRKDFYFGGRNQCFASGVIRKELQIYDVNSMYPYVMKSVLHPIGTTPILSSRVEQNTCFVVATGRNFGAFPVRTKEGGLDFTVPHGRFSTTIHEWNAALETGTFKPEKVHKTYGFDERITFEEFVTHFFTERAAAKRKEKETNSAPLLSLFYKFVLNSAYGKFAQNPENYSEYCLTMGDEKLCEPCPNCFRPNENESESERQARKPNPKCDWCEGSGFKWSMTAQNPGKYTIWEHPTMMRHYYNITTGASITGAARALLLRGLSKAVNPVYCDTDSIICERMAGVDINETELGAWKHEGSGLLTAICGKKLYAVFDLPRRVASCCCTKKDEVCAACVKHGLACVKKAHKGCRLSGEEILRIAKGEEIETANPVPHFKLGGAHEFTTRRIRRTSFVGSSQ